MLEVRKYAEAERDLIEIWQYSFVHWGEAQADLYLDRIEEAVERLRERPGLGVDCSEIRARYRRWKVGEHHIYYITDTRCIHVIRVLNARQNAVERLQE